MKDVILGTKPPLADKWSRDAQHQLFVMLLPRGTSGRSKIWHCHSRIRSCSSGRDRFTSQGKDKGKSWQYLVVLSLWYVWFHFESIWGNCMDGMGCQSLETRRVCWGGWFTCGCRGCSFCIGHSGLSGSGQSRRKLSCVSCVIRILVLMRTPLPLVDVPGLPESKRWGAGYVLQMMRMILSSGITWVSRVLLQRASSWRWAYR